MSLAGTPAVVLTAGFVACAATSGPPKSGDRGLPPVQSSGEKPPETSRAAGKAFSVLVPAGFTAMSLEGAPAAVQAVIQTGGVVLREDAPPAGVFRGSIVVTPFEDPAVRDDATSCASASKQATQASGVHCDKPVVVGFASGTWCQFSCEDPGDATRRARGTVLHRDAQQWMVICNYDRRDVRTPEACRVVIEGWQFTK
jgi:hypothetical protein